jgi:hypothetical protein
MKTSTAYFWIVVLVIGIGAVYFLSSTQRTNCSDFDHTTLVLIDQTDSIGEEAKLTAKEFVWETIEKAPDFSRVVFKEIVGNQVTSGAKREDIELCREIQPTAVTDITAAPSLKKKWAAFKDKVCGTNRGSDGTASCGSPERNRDGYLDWQSTPSDTSPILEKVADAARQYLTAKPQSWDLVVISDWRQFTGNIDLHRQPCSSKNMPDYATAPVLGGQSSKIFSVSGSPSRQSTVQSLFVTRRGMNNDEANCLRQFAQGFFLSELEGGLLPDNKTPKISPPMIKDLPQS